ncbi:MAG: antibiotic biosynthesis monooxygenase [Dehalococcoidia bacterium]|nr:antibiotic biosynthesis monooxygenase [Dehalococcoidia bacterium]
MAYIRLSIARPRKGEEARLEQLMRQIAEAVSQQEGCIDCYVLKPHDDSGEIARISIYTNEDAAEQAANTAHIMSLRSEQHLLSEPGHVERAFFTV